MVSTYEVFTCAHVKVAARPPPAVPGTGVPATGGSSVRARAPPVRLNFSRWRAAPLLARAPPSRRSSASALRGRAARDPM